ncbi:hypothetical protein [Palleronia abyssalis]|uniref:Uncharacterized protein n=1 Tax=Palleronia abyssalis TaxID=1501240 RepID=A0A2R8BXZ9_9RHOB|nr:hypothetical protein [Palleronia abyssalis]SPJ25038.1 hypothetical protein PAA8504_02881 [Palleronia abyssalis]
MPLTKMIDLIAEVAAKRAAQGREPKENASDAVRNLWLAIWAKARRQQNHPPGAFLP